MRSIKERTSSSARDQAADQDHRPAILLGVGEPGEAVHDARTGHNDAGGAREKIWPRSQGCVGTR